MGAVRAQVNQLDRNLALTNGQTIGQLLAQGLWAARMGAALLGLFGLLALVLASVGIYGVLSYSVTQRTSEIGIRMALGAQSQQVLKLVLRQGMLLAAVGVLVGVAVALPVTRFASTLLYGVSVWDPRHVYRHYASADGRRFLGVLRPRASRDTHRPARRPAL